ADEVLPPPPALAVRHRRVLAVGRGPAGALRAPPLPLGEGAPPDADAHLLPEREREQRLRHLALPGGARRAAPHPELAPLHEVPAGDLAVCRARYRPQRSRASSRRRARPSARQRLTLVYVQPHSRPI